MLKVWKQIGRTACGKAIFENIETGEIGIEKDFMCLVKPQPEELERAEISD